MINNFLSPHKYSFPPWNAMAQMPPPSLADPQGNKVELLVDLPPGVLQVQHSTSWNTSFPHALITSNYQLKTKSFTPELPCYIINTTFSFLDLMRCFFVSFLLLFLTVISLKIGTCHLKAVKYEFINQVANKRKRALGLGEVMRK